MTTTTINIKRLEHLLALYRMPKAELLRRISEGLANPISEDEIFTEEIKLSHLKKIDKIFGKGLGWYADPSNPKASREESIFFRKDHFNADLNFGARKVVQRFEEEKIGFSTLTKLSDIQLPRKLRVYQVSDKPAKVAEEIAPVLCPRFTTDIQRFLKNFIGKLAEFNILVFEFVERHNTREKANINGFYLAPNVIVLKRQKVLKREIFTLAHELGHYLLNEEEIDNNIAEETTSSAPLDTVETWCNDFAFYFLGGQYAAQIEHASQATEENNYLDELIDVVANHTLLSRLALYTRLRKRNKISATDYSKLSAAILQHIKETEEAEAAKFEAQRQEAEAEGRTVFVTGPKPIVSPLYLSTLQVAFYSGLLSEGDFCRKLNIKPEKLDKYLQ